MRFWDTSAIVPLLTEESASRACRHLARLDPIQAVWIFTRTEVCSALWRRHRENEDESGAARKGEARLDKLEAAWMVVDNVEQVGEIAERMLRIHPLTASDALQLGAALVAFNHRAKGNAFVCRDAALCNAAAIEGFDVIEPK